MCLLAPGIFFQLTRKFHLLRRHATASAKTDDEFLESATKVAKNLHVLRMLDCLAEDPARREALKKWAHRTFAVRIHRVSSHFLPLARFSLCGACLARHVGASD